MIDIALLSTDTLTDVVRKMEEAEDAARRAAFDHAKTNVGRLIAAGVITTCDDEYERAQAAAGVEVRALAAGRPVAEQAKLERDHRELHEARAFLGRVVELGETPAERAARRGVILAAARNPGAKPGRRCSHRTTRHAQGWAVVDASEKGTRWIDAEDVEHTTPPHPDGVLCYRCGAFVSDTDLTRTGDPTDAAKAAAAILAAAGPAVFEVRSYGRGGSGRTGFRLVSALTPGAAAAQVESNHVHVVVTPAPFDVLVA